MSKFKVGQTWRTRGGDLARVILVDPKGYVDFQFADGRVDEFDNRGDPIEWRSDSEGVDVGWSKSNRRYAVELSSSVYIAGPMTDYPDQNFPAFNAAAKLWRDKGCFVINPAELNGGDAELALYDTMTDDERAEHYTACMRKDIAAITTVDTLVVLPGYVMSKGAMFEIQVAQFLGLTIVWP